MASGQGVPAAHRSSGRVRFEMRREITSEAFVDDIVKHIGLCELRKNWKRTGLDLVELGTRPRILWSGILVVQPVWLLVPHWRHRRIPGGAFGRAT